MAAYNILAFRLNFSLVVLVASHVLVYVNGHFLFAWPEFPNGDKSQATIQVSFAEATEAMKVSSVSFLNGQVQSMQVFHHSSTTNEDISDKNDAIVDLTPDDKGFLTGSLDNENINRRPAYITGDLDFGSFHGSADLSYTFSTQLLSASKYEDWKDYFHELPKRIAATEGEEAKVRVALRPYGPPYEVTMGGLEQDHEFQVCLYKGRDGSKAGCTTGTPAEKGHLIVDVDEESEYEMCGTFFALANTTTMAVGGNVSSLWSSVSVELNRPCSDGAAQSSANGKQQHLNARPTATAVALLLLGFVFWYKCRASSKQQKNGHTYSVPSTDLDAQDGYKDEKVEDGDLELS